MTSKYCIEKEAILAYLDVFCPSMLNSNGLNQIDQNNYVFFREEILLAYLDIIYLDPAYLDIKHDQI